MVAGKILFRCDADVAIGTGHVMRCLALAQAWQDAGGHAMFALAKLPEALLPRLKSEGIDTLALPVAAGSDEDAQLTSERARAIGAEWIVVDGDHFTPKFLAATGSGMRIALIDDFANRESYPVDLVVNSNLEASEEAYRTGVARGRVLTGIEYVLLRREFRNKVERTFPEVGNRILVTLGGSDPENLAPRVVEALTSLKDLRITIVAGAGYRDRLPMLSAPNLDVKFNVSDMPAVMGAADMAIVVAGGTLWELLRMQCVVLSYSRNALQEQDLGKLEARKILVNMGPLSGFDPSVLAATVRRIADSQEVRRQMGGVGSELVDGQGAERVVRTMQELARV